MASDNLEIVPFTDATRVSAVDSHVYSANLVESYCIGSVPNGGYVASCILRTASEYLAARGQPDVISAHFEYVNRTEVGRAILVIEDVKLGRALSSIQITLYQHDLQTSAPWITSNSRKEIIGFMTNTKLSVEKGLSLPTGWALDPPPPPVDLVKMAKGEDLHWAPRPKSPSPRTNSYARAQLNIEIFSPRRGQPRRGVEESWIRFVSGEGFTNASLGFVADCFPYVVEAWRPKKGEPPEPYAQDELFWYPTVTMNLDVKKELREGENDWIFVRTSAKAIQNGRFDLDVVILDKHGDIVALSTHMCLILSAARNLGARSNTKGKI
ncbi:hypothetical protein jhhlp_000741 [Lomentospora prolificans]|uniref:Thioesterase domain-containing protein n=1 Tax=Lomentospora prolificans TaxID=41688 RepID=A0A2N3NJC3_9PEZI|nr:hypothetical protein jhhlp_000741 [Lomentospora prolificans]